MRQWVALFLVLTLSGCSADALINESQEIPEGTWAYNEPISFEVEVKDTMNGYDYYVLMRHGGNYHYRNLIVSLKTFYPDNTYKIDTFNCPLAAPNGKWFGSGLGDILDHRVLVKVGDRFPKSGPYRLELQHTMRTDTVEEIYDIGLLIEPSKR